MIENETRIIKIEGNEYATTFANIYNCANELYPVNERHPADGAVFHKQLQEDENYIYVIEQETVGFMSYHKYEQYFELTSLYVTFSKQKQGIGEALLNYFEHQVPRERLMVVKALNDSPWAIHFYTKHGYMKMTEVQLQSFHLVQHNWETILCKKKE